MLAALDNPIWAALNSTHAHLAESNGMARRYAAAITALAGMPDASAPALDDLTGLLNAGDYAALFLTELPPVWPSGIQVLSIEEMLQMIWAAGNELPALSSENVVVLGTEHVPQMMALAQLTKPGPFGPRTIELGGFIGIFAEGRLVAMAGQRLRTPGITEISAVCTHPDYRGRRYSSVLMSQLIATICARKETPILHVRAENKSAIAVYEKLGFRRRRNLQLVIVGRK